MTRIGKSIKTVEEWLLRQERKMTTNGYRISLWSDTNCLELDSVMYNDLYSEYKRIYKKTEPYISKG